MKKRKHLSLFLILMMSIFIMDSCKKASLLNTENLDPINDVNLDLLTGKNKVPTFVSNPKNLNIVMFIPTDNPAQSDYKERLSRLFIHFQDWLHSEMMRYGYDKYLGLSQDDSTKLVKIIEIHAQGGQAEYPYNAGVSAQKIINEINHYKSMHPSEFSNTEHTLVLLPQRTDGTGQGVPFYGYGKICFALDNADMDPNNIPEKSQGSLKSTYYIGGMLHELGHGLNLPHDHAKYESEQPTLGTSLMGAGNSSFSKGEPTFLTEVDAAILNRNEVFQSVTPAEAPYESGNANIDVNGTLSNNNQTLNLTGSFTSDKEVSDILVYLDPDVNNEGPGVGSDYNAVAWRFNPGSNNSISGTIPLSELYYKTNETYEVKAKLFFTNGAVTTWYYQMSFLNGVPQIGANGTVTCFQNISYGGYSKSLPVGQYTTADLMSRGINNNDISSIKVDLGVKVILYDGDNFTGDSRELTFRSWNLPGFTDKTSSIKVMAR